MGLAPDSSPLPAWTRTLDVVSLALAALACVIAVSGGCRLHIGMLRLGVTSPLPPMFWAVAIGVARHVAVRRRPLYREFPDRLRQWSRLRPVRCAAAAVVATRP